MNQHKEAAYWKKRKTEVERAVKVLTQKREKTLYLYQIEKESRRKTRELQLRTLLEYETKELHQNLAGLQSINAKITALESEQKKHNNVKLFGWLSLFIVVFAFAGLIIHHNYGENQEMPLEESSISWTSSWSDKIVALLKKYSSGNNALTGAVVGIQPIIEEPVVEEPSTEIPEEEPIVENPPAEEVEIPVEEEEQVEEDIPEVRGPIADNWTETEEVVEEGLEVAPVVEEKSIFRSIIDSIIENIFPEDLTLLANAQVTRLLLNTTYVTQGNNAVNLTAYATLTDASQKAIYNWLRNDSSIAVLNMPFEGGSLSGNSSGTTNGAKDYTPYSNNGSVHRAVWNSTGGYDHNGSFELVNTPGSQQFINITDDDSLDMGTNDFTVMAWIRTDRAYTPSTDPTMTVISKNNAGTFEGYAVRVATALGRLSIYIRDASGATTSGFPSSAQVTDGNWYHFAITFDRDASATLYINGQPNGSNVSIGTRSGSINNTNNLHVGNWPELGGLWNGTIDELMIFNRLISAEQIYAIWRNQSNVLVNQEVNKGDKWTVQVTPNNGTDDGAMMEQSMIIYPAVIQSFTLNSTNLTSNDTSVNLTAYTSTADPNGDSVKVIYNWLVNDTPIAVLNMPFEEVNGTNYNNSRDYSGLQNHGNETNGVLWNATAGYDGKGAYQFDGVNDYIDLGDKDYFKTMCNNGCTFSAWVWTYRVQNNHQAVIARSDTTNSDAFFQLQLPNTNESRFYITANGTGLCTATGGGIAERSWNHITGRYNGTHSAVFLNGSEVAATACAFSSVNSTAWADSEKVFIGIIDETSPGNFFNGTIDEVMVWNRSLPAEQIYALWRNQTDVIVAQETVRGENWTVQATPNDGFSDGTFADGTIAIKAKNETILNGKPVITALVLNSTNVTSNNTNVNLTAYATTSDADPDDTVKVIYNWLRNGSSFTVLNMPFEGGSLNGNSSGTTNGAKDYTPYSNNGSVHRASWNSTGGYDNNGAYKFVNNPTGTRQFINITDDDTLDIGTNDFTVTAWIKYNESGDSTGSGYRILSKRNSSNTGYELFIEAATSAGLQRLAFSLNDGTGTVFGGAASATDLDDDKWHHVAVTFDRDASATYYVDGVPDGSPPNRAISARQGSLANTAHLTIGMINPEVGAAAGANDFNGTIDELMIFNRSLSAGQIYAIWRNQTNTIVANETVGGEKWSVQATPNDGYEDGQLVMSSNITIRTTPNITTLVLNTTNLSSNKTEVNLTAYATVVEPDGDSVRVIYNWLRNETSIALLNLPFEGGSLSGNSTGTTNGAKDYTPFSYNGTVFNAFWNSTGGYDNRGAFEFVNAPDSRQFINITDNGNLDIGTNDFTLMAWIKSNVSMDLNDITSMVIIGKRDSNNKGYRLAIQTTPARRRLSFLLGDGISLASGSADSATDLVDNKWHHVAVTFDRGASATYYVDGVPDGSPPTRSISALSGKSVANTVHLAIGIDSPEAFAGVNGFNGTIDEVIIFNRSLSAAQIYAIWRNQSNVITTNETVRGENWTVQATPNDGTEDGPLVISNNLTIVNTAPTIPVLWNLTNRSTVTTRTPTFVWNVSNDADGEAVTYRIQVDDNILFNNLEVNVGGITNTTINNVTYTLSTELGVDTSYFWRVLANDSLNAGSISETRNFTVQSYLAINVTEETVAFGTLPVGANVSTPNNASPFRVENVGNIIANITVTGTAFFTAVSMPSSFYRFKIRANESGAFNTTASATEWNQTNSTLGANIFHVINLDWHSISNDFLTDLNISVPGNETPGSKTSTMTFTITG